MDLLSIVKADLIKVGVDMDIHQMENGVFNTLNRSRAHKEMIMKGSVDYAFPWRLMMVRGESMDNPSLIDDSTFRAAYETMGKAVGADDAKVSATLKGDQQVQSGAGMGNLDAGLRHDQGVVAMAEELRRRRQRRLR